MLKDKVAGGVYALLGTLLCLVLMLLEENGIWRSLLSP